MGFFLQVLLREAAKRFFLFVGSLRGGVKAGLLRKKNFFEAPKKSSNKKDDH